MEEIQSAGAVARGRRPGRVPEPLRLDSIEQSEAFRLMTGIGEFDRVLGGGMVPGAVTLVGGDPGIGKSTLVLQALAELAKLAKLADSNSGSGSLLYISAEESPSQIKLRADRMGLSSPEILILPATSVEEIIEAADAASPGLIAVDSIQMVHTAEIASAPGSVGQVRESAARLTAYAKKTGVPMLIIGHVTKDGSIAGPKVLEHIVDTVLYFEGDGGRPFRILRTVKNRFGSTHEIGVFTMTGRGLVEVSNPSELFLAEHSLNVPGSVVTASVEGTRPLLIEIQALVSPSGFGNPRRTALGIDTNRGNIILAVLEKRAGLQLSGCDVYLNVVGGIRLDDTAADLAIAIAAASSLRDKPVPPRTMVFGEIGLSGELRAVARADSRLKEAAKLGFETVVMPEGNASGMDDSPGMKIIAPRNVEEALLSIFS